MCGIRREILLMSHQVDMEEIDDSEFDLNEESDLGDGLE